MSSFLILDCSRRHLLRRAWRFLAGGVFHLSGWGRSPPSPSSPGGRSSPGCWWCLASYRLRSRKTIFIIFACNLIAIFRFVVITFRPVPSTIWCSRCLGSKFFCIEYLCRHPPISSVGKRTPNCVRCWSKFERQNELPRSDFTHQPWNNDFVFKYYIIQVADAERGMRPALHQQPHPKGVHHEPRGEQQQPFHVILITKVLYFQFSSVSKRFFLFNLCVELICFCHLSGLGDEFRIWFHWYNFNDL